MKKIMVSVLVALMLLGTLFAGGQQDTATNGKLTKETIKVGFVYIGHINDEGYTQAHDKGRLEIGRAHV